MAVPPACQSIKSEIEALELVRDAVQATMESLGPGQKPAALKEVRRLNREIADLSDDLADCIVASTPIPSTPSLSIGAIMVVQAIQTPTDEAALVAGKRTGVRVFVGSGLPGGPPFPPGTGVVPNVTGSLVVTDVSSGASATLQPLNPGGVIEAAAAADPSLNRLDRSLLFELPPGFLSGTVRLTATASVVGQPALSAPAGTKTVTFLPQQRQNILPILLSDPLLGLQAPDRSTFAATLADARKRMPVAEQGFVVLPPIQTTLSPGIDLRGGFGWGWLCFNLATWVFLFPTQDVGGLRTALVPNTVNEPSDRRYAYGGIATWRIGPSNPASASQAGLGTTVAHELGHTFALGHASCPPPGTDGAPGQLDSRLPATLRYPGLDVSNRRLIPSGTGELMSYCGDEARWPSEDFWEAVRTRVPI
jgi:hypothetical protein